MYRIFFFCVMYCGGDIGFLYVCGSYKVIILWVRLKEKIDIFNNLNV